MIKKFNIFLITESLEELLQQVNPRNFKTFEEFKKFCINHVFASFHDEESQDEFPYLQKKIQDLWNSKTNEGIFDYFKKKEKPKFSIKLLFSLESDLNDPKTIVSRVRQTDWWDYIIDDIYELTEKHFWKFDKTNLVNEKYYNYQIKNLETGEILESYEMKAGKSINLPNDLLTLEPIVALHEMCGYLSLDYRENIEEFLNLSDNDFTNDLQVKKIDIISKYLPEYLKKKDLRYIN